MTGSLGIWGSREGGALSTYGGDAESARAFLERIGIASVYGAPFLY